MNSDESLALAVSEWQRKHGIQDGDPIIAMLDLVRLHLRHSAAITPEAKPPEFDDFRRTIESLDSHAKSFASRSADLIISLRQFSKAIDRINHARWLTHFVFTALGIIIGALLAHWI